MKTLHFCIFNKPSLSLLRLLMLAVCLSGNSWYLFYFLIKEVVSVKMMGFQEFVAWPVLAIEVLRVRTEYFNMMQARTYAYLRTDETHCLACSNWNDEYSCSKRKLELFFCRPSSFGSVWLDLFLAFRLWLISHKSTFRCFWLWLLAFDWILLHDGINQKRKSKAPI